MGEFETWAKYNVGEFAMWDQFATWMNCGVGEFCNMGEFETWAKYNVGELGYGRFAIWANFNSPLQRTQKNPYHARDVFFCVFTCIFTNVQKTHV